MKLLYEFLFASTGHHHSVCGTQSQNPNDVRGNFWCPQLEGEKLNQGAMQSLVAIQAMRAPKAMGQRTQVTANLATQATQTTQATQAILKAMCIRLLAMRAKPTMVMASRYMAWRKGLVSMLSMVATVSTDMPCPPQKVFIRTELRCPVIGGRTCGIVPQFDKLEN